MAFDLKTETGDFFSALKPLIPKALDFAHQFFELILIDDNRIKKGEYDRAKVNGGVFVKELKIWDETYGFNLEGVGFSSTPDIKARAAVARRRPRGWRSIGTPRCRETG